MLSWLKWARVGVATVFFVGLSLAFIDFRHVLPHGAASFLASAQFVPAAIALLSGTALAVGAVIVLAVTLAAGRIYCSAICPLGILQDVIARMASLFHRKKKFLRYAPAKPWLRHLFFWATLITIPIGGAGLGIMALDPYSNFGRIFSVLVRPAVFFINDFLVPIATKWNVSGFYHIEIYHAPLLPTLGVAAFFLLLIFLAAWRGRIYCNTICPVGTLLGFVASRSWLKLKIDAATCGKCAECLKSCKAQCIDLKSGTVDSSRCVACYNCLTACERGAMRLEPRWSTHQSEKSVSSSSTQGESKPPYNPGRRQFLLTATGGAFVAGAALVPAIVRANTNDKASGQGEPRKRPDVITPPIAAETETFLEKCTACQLCISSCVTGVLQPTLFEYSALHFLKPHMDYRHAFCNYTCHRCSEVCPTGAIPHMPLSQKKVTRVGVAQFTQANCIVNLKHTNCAACSEHCPTKAVHMVPFVDGLSIPEVDQTLCIGCGACQYACPADTKAIIVHDVPHGTQARRPSEDKAINPNPKAGFPF